MTQTEMRQATGLGPDWQLIWEGEHVLPSVEHICAGLYGPGGTYRSQYVRLEYVPVETVGIEVARCGRCRLAWVRAI